jgi:HEPN domain-containing protein
MPPDPARIEDTRAWLHKAEDNLRAGAHSITAEPPLTFDVTFHAQQACEKALKALLAWHDRPFRKTHNIDEIGEVCLGIDPSLRDLVDRAAPLTEYARRFRYPGEAHDPTRGEAESALAVARDVLQAVLARLPAFARPTGSG